MLFNRQNDDEISKYGIGIVAKAGKYHLVASMEKENAVKRLCISQEVDAQTINGTHFRWFDDRVHAIDALRRNKRACHKCMRCIEEEAFKQGWSINLYG